jgi:hypothetical protein
MSGTFFNTSDPRFNGSNLRLPRDLPHGLVMPPPEILAQVAGERAKFDPEIFNDAYTKLTLDDRTLAYYYEGFEVAYRSIPEGIEVLAVGVEEINAFVQGKSQGELLTFTTKEV